MIGPAIRNYKLQPPPGGWGVNYTFNDQEWAIAGPSPYSIFSAVKDIQKANGAFIDDESIWDFLNEIWTGRVKPGKVIPNWRRSRPGTSASPKFGRIEHWKIGPEKWGPIAWYWLHMHGTVFDKASWLQCINRIDIMLDPERSPDTGCDRCSNEWKVICSLQDPKNVTNEVQAAAWSYAAHNHVNRKLGKRIMPWASAAKTYGWKVTL